MLAVHAIDETSPHLAAVKKLGKAHSATLGFLPEGAFDDYARGGGVIVALDGSDCVGYLLNRIARDRVTLAHFCVTEAYRKQGVGRAMLNYLIAETKQYRGIILSCRRDYEASKTWPRLGFCAIGEVTGRAAAGSQLVRWWLDYGHPDLFSGSDEPAAIEAAFDANIFIDLVDRRNEESLSLNADWLQPLVKLCYTPELLNEINRNNDKATRAKRKAEAQQFKMVRYTPEAYQAAEQLLQPLFGQLDNPQDESDFRHLVRALAAEVDVFVTRDQPLLERAEAVYAACGLSILRPAELIGRIDIIEHEREYQRNFVAGTRHVSQERVNCADDSLISAIQCHGEQKKKLAAKFNQYVADAQRSQCYKMTGSNGETLAAFIVQRDSGIDRVPLLRVCGKRRAGTIARAVLTGLVRQAVMAGSRAVFITDSLSEAVQLACTDLGFLPVQGGRLKLVLSGWHPIDSIAAMLDWSDAKIADLKAALPAAKTDAAAASQIEHLLWPAKLADAPLPCFIVPIRPQFAEHLFDGRLANGGLFGADVDLALNPESAYYRAARPAIVTCPARCLWYVSASDLYDGTMAIRACSRIVEVVCDTPKRLHSRFKRLGVYEFSHVLATADGDKDKQIMAFRFDDSEQLRPISWATFQAILNANGITNNVQSPVLIPAAVFGQIYASAFDSSETR